MVIVVAGAKWTIRFWWFYLNNTLLWDYPPGELDPRQAARLREMDRWSDHLAFKYRRYLDGDLEYYSRRDDPYYQRKWEVFVDQHPRHGEERAAVRERHDRDYQRYYHSLNNEERDEVQPEEDNISEDDISTDDEAAPYEDDE